jgi:hypothetical protein
VTTTEQTGVPFQKDVPHHRMQLMQIIYALSTNITTGLEHKVNFLAHAKRLGWVPANVRTRKQALPILVKLAKDSYPRWKPGVNTQRALNKCKTRKS